MNNSKEIPRKRTTSHEDYFQDRRLEAKDNGNQLRKDILQGKYKPKSVRRAEILKSDRGVRLLGILNSNRQND